jgi:hypothetical protein
MRKQVPPEKTKDVLDFATKKPRDRLESIVNGLGVCGFHCKDLAWSHVFTGARLWPIRVCSPVRDERRFERSAQSSSEDFATSDAEVWSW